MYRTSVDTQTCRRVCGRITRGVSARCNFLTSILAALHVNGGRWYNHLHIYRFTKYPNFALVYNVCIYVIVSFFTPVRACETPISSGVQVP
jgi:hypothetical protein